MLLGISITILLAGLFYFLLPESMQDPITLIGFINIIPLTVLLLAGYRFRGGSWAEVFPLHLPRPADVIMLPAIALGLSIVLSQADTLFRIVVPVPDAVFQTFIQLITGSNLILILLTVSVLVPVAEEFFFRGIMLQGLLQNYSSRRALLTGALFFALYHLNPWQFLAAFFGGLVMGWIYYRNGNLLHAVLLHGLYNALPVLKVRLGVSIKGYISMESTPDFQPLWFFSLGIFLIGCGLYYFYRRK